jgi:hypothetical protein
MDRPVAQHVRHLATHTGVTSPPVTRGRGVSADVARGRGSRGTWQRREC